MRAKFARNRTFAESPPQTENRGRFERSPQFLGRSPWSWETRTTPKLRADKGGCRPSSSPSAQDFQSWEEVGMWRIRPTARGFPPGTKKPGSTTIPRVSGKPDPDQQGRGQARSSAPGDHIGLPALFVSGLGGPTGRGPDGSLGPLCTTASGARSIFVSSTLPLLPADSPK